MNLEHREVYRVSFSDKNTGILFSHFFIDEDLADKYSLEHGSNDYYEINVTPIEVYTDGEIMYQIQKVHTGFHDEEYKRTTRIRESLKFKLTQEELDYLNIKL